MRYVLTFLLFLAFVVGGLMLAAGFYLSPQDKLEKTDAIVVISGGETTTRTEEGVKLFHEGYAPLMIMSGAARDEGTSNAQAMELLAMKLGVPAENILIEEEAKNTLDNAVFVRELMKKYNIKSIILVTSPYHQRRAYVTFRKILGDDFIIINHSAPDSRWRKKGWWSSSWPAWLTISELQKIIYLHLLTPNNPN